MEAIKIPCLQESQSNNNLNLFIICFFAFSCSDLGKEEKLPTLRPYQTNFKVEDFSSAEDCKSCHPTHYQEWASSMHAYSMKDPVWIKLHQHEQEVHSEKGIELGDFCVQCHSPVASLTDAITNHQSFSLSDLQEMPPQIQEGVTCDVCHMVTHISEPTDIQTNNQSFETADFKLFSDGTRYSILIDPIENDYHTSEYHPGYDKSEFCQNCHNLTVNGINAEVTQFEWEGTAFQAMGSECQSCHMPTYEGQAAVGGPQRTKLHRHFFPGVDVQLNSSNPDPNHYSAVESLLLDAAELYVHDVNLDSLNKILNLEMKITNNSGHNFPTGTSFIRQLWLEVVGEINGDTIFSSGLMNENGDLSDFYIDPNRVLDPQIKIFNTVLYNADGDSGVLKVGVEDMVSLTDNSLPVSGSKTVFYSFQIPPGTQGILNIHSKLLFRSFPPFYLRFLELDAEAERIPIFEIDQKTALFDMPH
jgi:hypothetical protein